MLNSQAGSCTVTDSLAGKVAVVTGAGRGQGRSHAVELARSGADVVVVDICTPYATINYPMASSDDLAHTAALVTDLGRRVLVVEADVTNYEAMRAAMKTTVAEFGRVDVVVANAGICAMAAEQPVQAWCDVSAVNFVGVLNTLNAALPHLEAGASLIVTGSIAALLPGGPGSTPGGAAYSWAKRALVPLVRSMAAALGSRSIRVNGVHPTNCNTVMLQHQDMYRSFRPDLDDPTEQDAVGAFATLQVLPTPWVEPEDVSNAVVFLASDASRYVTGTFINVDGGGHLKG
jgi:SDR family mycofactocin-dependent oxidoreductase